jgi:ABC-type uncharacterized transport system involved in gliding motility auxiliary subunit
MKRQTSQALHVTLRLTCALIIVLALNGLARTTRPLNLFGLRVPLSKQWDLTQNKRYSLSEQTSQLLSNLKAPVKAYAFVTKSDEPKITPFLKRYEAASNQFSFKVVDIEKDPMTAKKYNVKQTWTVVLESGDHTDSVVLPTSNDSASMESKLSSGLLRLANPKKSTLYVTTGHGELPLDDVQTGLGAFKAELESENYTVKPLTLLQVKSIPADASAVIVAGLNTDLLNEEVTVLESYLKKGGRVLWLANLAVGKRPINLDRARALLARWGIDASNQLVVSMAMLGINSPSRVLIPAGMHYDAQHPVTVGFTNNTFYPVAQAINIGKIPTGATVSRIAWTNADTYTYKDALRAAEIAMRTQNPQAAFDPKTDKQGEANLAVAGTYPVKDDSKGDKAKDDKAKDDKAKDDKAKDDKAKKEARVVVIGNAELVTAQWLTKGGNGDLVLNAAAWLAERGEQIAVSRPSAMAKATALDEDRKSVLFKIGYLLPLFIFIGYFVVNGDRR